MKNFKNLTICALLVFGALFIQSCTDPCEEVTCEYDGICDDGDCVCEDVTTNYLIGEWLVGTSSGGIFNADNTYTDSFGNIVDWELDESTNTITLSTGNTLTISENDFNCEQMTVTIDNGSTMNELVFTRK